MEKNLHCSNPADKSQLQNPLIYVVDHADRSTHVMSDTTYPGALAFVRKQMGFKWSLEPFKGTSLVAGCQETR